MKTWKTYVHIDQVTPKLSLQEIVGEGVGSYERGFAAISDLTAKDISDLIVILQKERAQLEKLEKFLAAP